jgi:hypothetical protein
MARSKRFRARSPLINGAFVMINKSTLAAPAWRAMGLGPRQLYIHVVAEVRNDASNNGDVFLSVRDAAKEMAVTPKSIIEWYAALEHYGFLVKTKAGHLGWGGKGHAARYRVTEFPCGSHPPTREFDSWSGEPYQTRGGGLSRSGDGITPVKKANLVTELHQ